MSAISAVFTNLMSKTPLTASFGKVGLPTVEDEPLVTGKEGGSMSEKCELRIEGMTCGSCVEVSACAYVMLTWMTDLVHRRSRACCELNQASTRSK